LDAQARLQGRAQLADKLSAASRFLNQGRFDDAEQLFYQIQDPATVPLLNSLALTRARAGDWPRAITNFSRMIELAPSEPLAYYFLAPLLQQIGDLEAYEQHRQHILRQYSDAKVPGTVERMLKASLLLPLSDSGLEGVDTLALGKTLATVGPRALTQDAFRVARGLFEYRLNHPVRAIESLQNVGAGRQGNNPYFAVQACLISAMAQWRLGRTNEARATLVGCPLEAKTLKAKDFGPAWSDWLIGEAMRREAKALIAPEPATVNAGR
jgi:tetratricopeptide (TPR) repeat protein